MVDYDGAEIGQLKELVERLTRENWQLKGALGYPVPGDIPGGDFKCGLCEAGRLGFNEGWNRAIEHAALVAASYPEGFGDEYVAYGSIGSGQDVAAEDIAKAIGDLAPDHYGQTSLTRN
jgi:hypothetical protein